MAPASPTVARWELSLRLRERRLDLGLSAIDVAKKLGVTRNYISLVENDKTVPAEDKLQEFLDALSMDPEEQQKMFELRDISRQRGWWMDYASLFPEEKIVKYFGLEHGASTLNAYEGQMVNGLLQTEAYTRELMMADPLLSEVQIERLLLARRRRKERLIGVDPLQATIVMSETVLHQVVGTVQTLSGQLGHLLEVSERDNIDIRIVPFSNPPRGATGSSTFYLLGFPSARLPKAVWMEAGTPLELSTEPTKVEDLELRHRDALSASLSVQASRELIADCQQSLDTNREQH
jgi:transcriptional regulator with XRE-family HTH domain